MNKIRTILTLLVLLGTPITRRPGSAARSSASPRCLRARRIPRGFAWTATATSTSSPWRRTSPETSPGTLLVFDPNGKHLRTVHIAGSSRMLLDLRFHPQNGQAARDRLRSREGPRRRSPDGRFVRVHDGHRRASRPRRVDVRRRRQPVRDRRARGHDLESGTRRRRGRRSGSRARSSSQPGRHPPLAQMAWRSTTSRRRCSSPTPRKTRS